MKGEKEAVSGVGKGKWVRVKGKDRRAWRRALDNGSADLATVSDSESELVPGVLFDDKKLCKGPCLVISNRAMKALSVRQPWAWLIVNGYKDIENREWATKERGRIWIHTGVHRVTKAEYQELVNDCRAFGIKKHPGIDEFMTGGIVGSVEIIDCVTKSNSSWFEGKYGFVLKNARVSRFRPMMGKLNFFEIG